MPIVLSPDAYGKINRRLQTRYNTMAGTFEILRDGRRVAARLFKSEKEIMDFIGQQEPGDHPSMNTLPRTIKERAYICKSGGK